jgi:hypothetical protein
MTFYLHEVYFHVKIQLFVTAKSDQDPDPPMVPHRFGSLGPNQKAGSGFGLQKVQ